MAITTDQSLIKALSGGGPHQFPDELAKWRTESIYCEGISANDEFAPDQASPIIKAEFCADFCAYIAYDYSGGNKQAKFALKKFATSGIKNFIQELSGFKKVSDSSDTQQILSMLVGMQTQINEMSTKLDKAQGYFKASVSYPGLEAWLNDESIIDGDNDTLCLPESDHSWYTIEEAIEQLFPNIKFEKGNRISIGMMVAATWKSLHQTLPTKVVRVNDKGHKKAPVAAYPSSFIPFIKNDVIKFIVGL